MELKIGYYLDLYEDNYFVPFRIDLQLNPHVLVAGMSGSGKSYAIEGYVRQLQNQGVHFTVVDYKGEMGLRGAENYCGIKAFAGIENFYKTYKQNKKWKIMIIDEYPAMIGYLDLLDKKKSIEVKQQISEILMMGRSYHAGIFLVAQRPDSALFAGGARDNFGTRILFGRSSAESQKMMFPGERITYEYMDIKPGIGWAANGSRVYPIVYEDRLSPPFIYTIETIVQDRMING